MSQPPRQSGWARFIATWGPIVGLVGGLIGTAGGGLALLDRFQRPTVKVLDLIPVYISEPKIIAGANSATRGVGVLLHVQAENRPVSLTGLELGGKRCISFGEFHGFVNVEGRTDQDLETEFSRLRPFQLVSFFGWPTNRGGPISLTPWEESYVHFTFLEPEIGSPGIDLDIRYFGSYQRPSPLTRRYGFNVLEMFTLAPSDRTSWTAGHLRNEILDGVLVFSVLVGGAPITVPPDVLRPPKRLTPDAWKKGDLAILLAEKFPSLELKPTQDRSINCYSQPPTPGGRVPASGLSN